MGGDCYYCKHSDNHEWSKCKSCNGYSNFVKVDYYINVMNTKEIKINVPEGYTYYIENDTIKFERLGVTWEDIKSRLSEFWKNMLLNAECANLEVYNYFKLKAISDYLNKDWKPEALAQKWCIFKSTDVGMKYKPGNKEPNYINAGTIYFKSKEDTELTIRIMGEDLKYLF